MADHLLLLVAKRCLVAHHLPLLHLVTSHDVLWVALVLAVWILVSPLCIINKPVISQMPLGTDGPIHGVERRHTTPILVLILHLVWIVHGLTILLSRHAGGLEVPADGRLLVLIAHHDLVLHRA